MISLAKALKEKNKLVKKLTELERRITSENSYIEGSKNNYDSKTVYLEYTSTKNKLIELKSKIQTANAPVFEKIFKLSELKDTIRILNRMNTKEGLVSSQYDSMKDIVYVASIGTVERDSMVSNLETEIDLIQDELLEFNSKTKIDFSV